MRFLSHKFAFTLLLAIVPLPTWFVCAADLDDVLKELADSEEALHSFQVNCELSYKLEFYGSNGNRPDPETMPGEAVGLQSNSNSKWFFRRDSKWRVEVESTEKLVLNIGEPKVGKSQLVSVYDGAENKGKHVYIGSLSLSEESTDSLVVHNLMYRPTEFLYHYLDEPISRRLQGAKDIREEEFEKRKVLVAKTDIEVERDDFHAYHEFWFDLERSVVVRRRTYARRGAEKPWGLLEQRDTVEFVVEADNGRWLPARATTFTWIVTEKGQGKLSAACHYRFCDWEVNTELPKSTFSLDKPLVPSEN